MKKLLFLSAFASFILTGCNANENNNQTDSTEVSENVASAENAELTPYDLKVNNVKFIKAKNEMNGSATLAGDTLIYVAGAQTDYFRSPDGSVINNSPVIFTEVDNTKPFTFTAKVEPQFTETGTYSAGVLYAYENDAHCQKLCFEQSEDGLHRVVTVRTVETSDDNNHQIIPGKFVYMRLSSDGKSLGSYYSENGKDWYMVRLYKNDFPEKILLGLSSQSPKADKHTCYFTEVSLIEDATSDFRSGKLASE